MKAGIWRVPLGFVLAPLLPCFCVVAVFSGSAGHFDELAFLLFAMTIVCWIVTAVIGVPAYLVLRRFKRVTLRDCVVGGALAALAWNIVLCAMARSSSHGDGFSSDGGGAMALFGGCGVRGLLRGGWAPWRAGLV